MHPLNENARYLFWPGWLDRDPAPGLVEAIEKAGIAFVHIPKCAGNSLGEHLYGFGPGHRTWRWYKRVSVPTVAVVRDPIDRFLSAYDYVRTGGTTPADRFVSRFYVCNDVNRFVRILRWNPHLRSYFQFQTQSHYVVHRGKIMVDELVSFERLGERFPGLKVVNETKGDRTSRSSLSSASLRILSEIYALDFELYELSRQAEMRPIR